MTRVVYVNGRYRPYRQAFVHAEDRGFQFADSVYEVCEVRNGRLIDETRHMARLARSLRELSIRPPMSDRALGLVLRETIRQNRVTHGLVYLQVTRGAGPRDFPFWRAAFAKSRDPGQVAVRRIAVAIQRSWRRHGVRPTASAELIRARSRTRRR